MLHRIVLLFRVQIVVVSRTLFVPLIPCFESFICFYVVLCGFRMSYLNKTPDSDDLSLSPSTSCSSNGYQIVGDELILMTKKSLCPICGDISFNRHFGVNSC